jgi:hypothetical protein
MFRIEIGCAFFVTFFAQAKKVRRKDLPQDKRLKKNVLLDRKGKS